MKLPSERSNWPPKQLLHAPLGDLVLDPIMLPQPMQKVAGLVLCIVSFPNVNLVVSDCAVD